MAQHRDLIVIGASAGGVQAVRSLLAGLPSDLSAAVIVAIHSGARGLSHLATVLGARSKLRAASPSCTRWPTLSFQTCHST